MLSSIKPVCPPELLNKAADLPSVGTAIVNAGWLLEWQGSYQAVLMLAAVCTGMAMMLYSYVYLQLRITLPAVADAA